MQPLAAGIQSRVVTEPQRDRCRQLLRRRRMRKSHLTRVILSGAQRSRRIPLLVNGMRRMRGKPPLCKGRWIAEQDGGIVRKCVATWGMLGGRSKPLPYGCVPRPLGEVSPIGDGEGVTNEVIVEINDASSTASGPPVSPAGSVTLRI